MVSANVDRTHTRTTKADEMTTSTDTAPTTSVLTEERGAAPLFRTEADVVAVLAVCVISEGLEPSAKENVN